MHATRAAVEEGIVPGGGVTFIRALSVLEKLKLDEDEQIGVNIVRRALEEPLRQIAQNAGVEGAVVLSRVRAEKGENYGYNAATDTYGDLGRKVLLILPGGAHRLQNASSIAGWMLTTEALIADSRRRRHLQVLAQARWAADVQFRPTSESIFQGLQFERPFSWPKATFARGACSFSRRSQSANLPPPQG
jgi:chaperonin GroEL (HSP60 family)